MRFLYFLIAFFVCWCSLVSGGKFVAGAQSFEISAKSEVQKKLSSSGGKNEDDVSADFEAGLKLSVPFGKVASVQARMFQSFETEKDVEFSPRWGGEVSLFKGAFPILIRSGNLSFSQSASLLKNPAPSTASTPLRTSFATSSGLKSALPSSSGATKTVSYFADFSALQATLGGGPDFKIQALLTEDLDFYGSTGFELPFSRFSKVGFSFTGASAYIENESTTLKKAYGSFKPKRIFSFCAENIFSFPIIKAKFTFGATQTPWKDSTLAILENPLIARSEEWAVWVRGGFRFNLGHFLFDAEGFYAPFYDSVGNTPKATVLIGTSSEVLRTIGSVSVNPQVAFGNFKLGVNAILQDKMTSAEKPSRLSLLKTGVGISFFNRFFSMKLTATANNILISGEPTPASSAPTKSYVAALDFSLVKKLFRADFDVSATYYPPMTEKSSEKTTFKFSSDFSPGAKRLLKCSFDLEENFKGGEKTGEKFSFGAAFKIPMKRVKFFGSVKVAVGK